MLLSVPSPLLRKLKEGQRGFYRIGNSKIQSEFQREILKKVKLTKAIYSNVIDILGLYVSPPLKNENSIIKQ